MYNNRSIVHNLCVQAGHPGFPFKVLEIASVNSFASKVKALVAKAMQPLQLAPVVA